MTASCGAGGFKPAIPATAVTTTPAVPTPKGGGAETFAAFPLEATSAVGGATGGGKSAILAGAHGHTHGGSLDGCLAQLAAKDQYATKVGGAAGDGVDGVTNLAMGGRPAATELARQLGSIMELLERILARLEDRPEQTAQRPALGPRPVVAQQPVVQGGGVTPPPGAQPAAPRTGGGPAPAGNDIAGPPSTGGI